MGTATNDYDKLEREYIANPRMSIRGLCKKHGIKSYSSVAQYAREHGWYEKREKITARGTDRTIEKVSERLSEAEADDIEQFRTEALTIVRATLYKFAEDLKDPSYRVSGDVLVKLIQVGLLMTGQPTSRTEERRLDVVTTFDGLPTDVLRQLADATRPRAADARADGNAARAVDEGARAN